MEIVEWGIMVDEREDGEGMKKREVRFGDLRKNVSRFGTVLDNTVI